MSGGVPESFSDRLVTACQLTCTDCKTPSAIIIASSLKLSLSVFSVHLSHSTLVYQYLWHSKKKKKKKKAQVHLMKNCKDFCMQGRAFDLIFLFSIYCCYVSVSLLTNTRAPCQSQSMTTPKCRIVHPRGEKRKHYHWSRMRQIVTETQRFAEIISLKLLSPITSGLSPPDPRVLVSAGLLSGSHRLAPRGSPIHMHALFKVIRYDAPESPVLRRVCPAVMCGN